MTQNQGLVRAVMAVYMNSTMRDLISFFTRLFIVIALTFAMAGSSFAHRVAPSEIDESLLAYVAAGGALDDLCGGSRSGGGETCDACRLVDGATLPTVSVTSPSEIHASLLQTRKRASVGPLIKVPNPSCLVRAPPVV